MVVRFFIGIERNGARRHFHSADSRAGGPQFAAERIVVGVCAMIGFGVSIRGGANGLEISFGQRCFVLGKRAGSRSTSCEDNESAGAGGEAEKIAAFH